MLPKILWAIGLTVGGCKSFHQDKGSAPLIVGGEALGPDNPGRSSAVLITHDGEFRCSGVLVASDLVLTAAHCLQNQTAEGFRVQFSDQLDEDPAASRDVSAVRQFRPWSRLSSAHYDIAWLKLSTPAPSGYKPVPILTDPRKIKRATRLTQVGYGRTSSFDYDYGTRLTVATSFNRHVNDSLWRNVFVTGPTPGYGTCEGDSGGPSYVEVAGVWHLVGVLFGAPPELFDDASCEAGQDVQTFAGYFKDWIEETSGSRLEPTAAAPVPPRLDSPTNAAEGGFSAWCAAATKLTSEPWYTVVQTLRALQEPDCRRAAAKLARMTKLDLSARAISDLRPLAGLANLDTLHLQFNAVADVSPLSGMRNMKTLLLHSNAVTHLASLASLRALSRLQISCNAITDLSPLRGLADLTIVKASINRITSLQPLTSLSKLELVEVLGNPIDDPAAVATLSNGPALFIQGEPAIADCSDGSWITPDLR